MHFKADVVVHHPAHISKPVSSVVASSEGPLLGVFTSVSPSVGGLPSEAKLPVTFRLQATSSIDSIIYLLPKIMVRRFRMKEASPFLIHPSFHVDDMIGKIR